MDSDTKGVVIIICAIILGIVISFATYSYNSRVASEGAIKSGLHQAVVNNNIIWVKIP